jgi:hypothetical protein
VTVLFDRNGLSDLTIIGSKAGSSLGIEEAVGGVSIEVRNLSGERVGTVLYLDAAGHVQPAATSTGANGGFVVLNVPSGIAMIRSTNGGTGNSMIDVISDSVSYTKLKTVVSQSLVVSVSGRTYDPVGPPPFGVPVGAVNIEFLGAGVETKSDQVTGSYQLNLAANSEYVLKLFFDIPSQ